MPNSSPDFQNSHFTFLQQIGCTRHVNYTPVSKSNILDCASYFTVRLCFEHTWVNHNDQFFYSNDVYKSDKVFQNDCLIYALFRVKNVISAQHGVNYWIPFTEKEVGAREKFESNFMSGFLKGRTLNAEATAVLDAGRELWKYYHAKIKNNKTVSVNSSYYDIREYFQGRKVSGNMNTKSTDETYNALLATLRGALKTLTRKMQPKVYEYGFLKE